MTTTDWRIPGTHVAPNPRLARSVTMTALARARAALDEAAQLVEGEMQAGLDARDHLAGALVQRNAEVAALRAEVVVQTARANEYKARAEAAEAKCSATAVLATIEAMTPVDTEGGAG